MFCHTLALALGMTVAEVQEKVSPEELKWWKAYHSISPIGKERDDYNAALIAQSVLNANSKKPFKIDDVVLKWGKKKMIRGAKNIMAILRGMN